MSALSDILAVAAGSGLGGTARYALSRIIRTSSDYIVPWDTLSVNLIGCLVIGLIYGLLDRGFTLSTSMKLFLTVGLCGGFTTFSTFMNDNYRLLQDGRHLWPLIAYATASLAGGLLVLWLGYRLSLIFHK